LLLRARLELAGALARDAELAAERCERDLLVAHEALLEDEALSLVEPLERVAEVALDQAAALLVEVDGLLVAVGLGQGVEHGRARVVVEGRAQRHVARIDAPEHVLHLLLRDVEALGELREALGRIARQVRDLRALAPQPEEELA